jgi:hypothetical protein
MGRARLVHPMNEFTAGSVAASEGMPLLRAVKRVSQSQGNDGVDDARAACGSMKSGAKMVVVRATV